MPKAIWYTGSLQSGNGAVDAERLSLRNVWLQTSNGRIRLLGCACDGVGAHTSNGRVEASGLAGTADLRTSNGTIQVGLNPALGENRLALHTSNGPISVDGPRANVGWDVDVSTAACRASVNVSGADAERSSAGGHGPSQMCVTTGKFAEQHRRVHVSAVVQRFDHDTGALTT